MVANPLPGAIFGQQPVVEMVASTETGDVAPLHWGCGDQVIVTGANCHRRHRHPFACVAFRLCLDFI